MKERKILAPGEKKAKLFTGPTKLFRATFQAM